MSIKLTTFDFFYTVVNNMTSLVADVALLCIDNTLLWVVLPMIMQEGSRLFEVDKKVKHCYEQSICIPLLLFKGKKGEKDSMYPHSPVLPHLCVPFSVCFHVNIYLVAMALFCISIFLSHVAASPLISFPL